MKKEFVKPELSISMFNCENVVTTASSISATDVGKEEMKKVISGIHIDNTHKMAIEEILVF